MAAKTFIAADVRFTRNEAIAADSLKVHDVWIARVGGDKVTLYQHLTCRLTSWEVVNPAGYILAGGNGRNRKESAEKGVAFASTRVGA